MAAASPSLSLSDIMHPLSPPPVATQPKSSSPPLRARSITPEPLEPAEIEDMRRKILEMGWSDSAKGKEKIGTREQELVDMVLRLTHPASLPQASQLHAQAMTIAHLIQQRDFLVQRSAEEHERWECEREGWARAAQALIVQGRRESMQAEKDDAIVAQYALVTADASSQRLLEFERANLALQNDKKSLQQRLADSQQRLASLESELAQLKPILLMHPFTLIHSAPVGTARAWPAVLSTPRAAPSRRDKDRRAHDVNLGEDDFESDDETPQPSRLQLRNIASRSGAYAGQLSSLGSPESPSKPKGDYYRRREPSSPSAHYASAQYNKTSRRKVGLNKPFLSDARAEHLLLAARKIGRQRASILSGVFPHQRRPEPTSHYKQKTTPASPTKAAPQPPRTPRRNATTNAPLLMRTPLGQPSNQQPRTPLQSLLSAAQSVLSAPGSDSPSTGGSPLAKRRRLNPPLAADSSPSAPMSLRKERERNRNRVKDKDKDKDMDMDMDTEKEEEDGDNEKDGKKNRAEGAEGDKDKESAPMAGGVARVRSALDFLADQAEAYSTQPPSQASADSGGSPPKDFEDVAPQDKMDNGDSFMSALEMENVEAVATPRSASRANTPVTGSGHTQMDSFVNDPAAAENDGTVPPQLHPDTLNNGDSTPLSHTLDSTHALAPPIDLVPTRSCSPASQTGQRTSRKRSRSNSTDRHTSQPPTTENSFPMFSLKDPHQTPGKAVVDMDTGTSGGASTRGGGVVFAGDGASRRTRSPYVKWTKEEDELLAKAVAKHGQKWDLVQKALPSRGYHQVRQRWLRKLGMFDGNKLDLASLETNAAAEFLHISTGPVTPDESGGSHLDARSTAHPKLGLAPLNSEKVLTEANPISSFRTGDPGTGGEIEFISE